jgi:hypothetical protein
MRLEYKIMLCIFNGPTPANLPAEDVRDAVRAQISEPDVDPTIQSMKDGNYKLTLESGDVVGAAKIAGTQPVYISPSALKQDGSAITLADFPDNWSFGNGVSCNTQVTLQDGTIKILSWVVFPDAQEDVVRSREAALKDLFEGS